MGISRKRAIAAGLVVCTHVALVWVLATVIRFPVPPSPPDAQPIVATILQVPAPRVLERTVIKPKLLKLQIRPEQLPDLQIELPEERIVDTQTNATLLPGSPGPTAPMNSSGRSPTISVTHFVRPIYPAASRPGREHGSITVALLVDDCGSVSKVRVLRSSGSPRLDGAAVHALRQWKFTRAMNGTRAEPIWTVETIQFVPVPSEALGGVDFDITPYDSTMDQQISAAIVESHDDHRAPVAEHSLRRLILKLIATYTRASLEEALAMQGPVQSVRFLGFATHGLASDRQLEASSGRRPLGAAPTHWEIYDIQQQLGCSVWLVASTADGSIRSVEVAIRRSP